MPYAYCCVVVVVVGVSIHVTAVLQSWHVVFTKQYVLCFGLGAVLLWCAVCLLLLCSALVFRFSALVGVRLSANVCEICEPKPTHVFLKVLYIGSTKYFVRVCTRTIICLVSTSCFVT